MKILKINVLRGPNYWSSYRKKLIQLKIDLEKFESLPTNLLNDFSERLINLIPSLTTHYCSYKTAGGFVKRLEQGTWLGHVIEHVALELQCLAGMPCGFGRTRSTSKGVYFVIFSYEFECAGLYAAQTAFQIVQTLAHGQCYSALEDDVLALIEMKNQNRLGISTQSIVDEAIKRDIPYRQIGNSSLIVFGYGIYQKSIWAAVGHQTSSIGVEIASNKELTKSLLRNAYIPSPTGTVIKDPKDLEAAILAIGFPIVIKPNDGNHGRGITTNISTIATAATAFGLAKSISSKVIIERYIEGDDFRFLVVNYKVVAVAKRLPAYIIGDGTSTISMLMTNLNNDSKRGDGHSNFLTKVSIDKVTQSILKEKQKELDSILPLGEIFNLKYAANLSTGGTAVDVTDDVHRENILLIEKAARVLHLDICGVDVVTASVSQPITNNTGSIIEINAGPGLRMHLSPSEGKARNVAAPIVDMLYAPGSISRVPIIAVTGTNGKTTTVRLLAYLAKHMGYQVGYTATDGIYINNIKVHSGDCSGPISAKAVLNDPTINFAILECARGGILRSGLGFDKCDISIILNVTEDHLGIDEIHSLKQLARLKSVIAHSTKQDGYTILNADDDYVYSIMDEVTCRIALFSVNRNSVRIKDHCQNGGEALFIEDDQIIYQKHLTKIKLVSIQDLPISFYGAATCMFPNVLATILAGVLSKFPTADIINGLIQFHPTASSNPGRMNLFDFKDFKVLLDYGHNSRAYQEMAKFLDTIKANKIGIIAVPGDRRKEDIVKMGQIATTMFDKIIIRYEKSCRGRSYNEISSWLLEGIHSENSNKDYMIIPDEQNALEYAIKNVQKDSLIVHFVTDVTNLIEYLSDLRSKNAMLLNDSLHETHIDFI